MRKKSYYERFMAMTDAQRDAEVAKYDQEDLSPGKPLTARQRKQWNMAKRRGRPAKHPSQRARRILVTLPPALLKQTDLYAKEHGMSRAALVAQSLRAVVAA